MRRSVLSLLVVTLLVALPVGAGELTDTGVDFVLAVDPPTKVHQKVGQTASGAFYNFAVPDGWTPDRGLVIYNHGFSLSPISEMPDLGPLAPLQLSEGYAVAASSYSQIGWAVFQTVQDLEQMYDAFVDEFGAPAFTLINGPSLGGLVTVQAVEQADLGNVIGAFPFCGVISGSRAWDAGVDFRLLYDAVCGDVPGAAIPGGANGLAFPPDPDFDEFAMANAAHMCTGIAVPPAGRTAEQQARLDQILAIAQIPEEFFLTDLGFSVFGLADLVYDPGKMAGDNPMDNADVDYGDETINDTIERVRAAPEARTRMVDNYTPSGKIDGVKMLSIHTDKDGLVLVENQAQYAAKVSGGMFTSAVVVEDAPTHCGFTVAEVAAGWEVLRGWLGGAPKPTAVEIQGTCEALVAGSLATGPCRFDPTYVTADLSDRVRPRATCTADEDTLCLAADRFRLEVDFVDHQGAPGQGQRNELTGDTGSFWFFDPANVELVVKVLDANAFNQRFWVYYGSLTDVEFNLTVTDTETLKTRVYTNPAGTFASAGDTDAF